MPLSVACRTCTWEGTDSALGAGRTCPLCGGGIVSTPRRMARVAPVERAEVQVIERHPATDHPAIAFVLPTLSELMRAAAAEGLVLVHRDELAGGVARAVVPTPAPTVPVPLCEYALIVSHRGFVWASGAGIEGQLDAPTEGGVTLLLNALARHGYRVISTITTGDRAVWTLERPARGERVLFANGRRA